MTKTLKYGGHSLSILSGGLNIYSAGKAIYEGDQCEAVSSSAGAIGSFLGMAFPLIGGATLAGDIGKIEIEYFKYQIRQEIKTNAYARMAITAGKNYYKYEKKLMQAISKYKNYIKNKKD